MNDSSALQAGRRPGPASISVVVPCYNEEEVLAELRRRLMAALESTGIPFEIILIDDGSADRTWEIMQQYQHEDGRFKIIRFARNFGHQMALTCGLDQACGEVALIIDADLQDPPELLAEMLQKWREGYEVVYGRRKQRSGETILKRLFAYAFYRFISRVTRVNIPPDTGDFRLMGRKAIDALQSLRERHRFVRGMVSWVGFRQTPVYYDRPQRFAGTTKYPFRKSFLLAVDAITSFSHAPLRLATVLGCAISVFAFIYILVVLVLKFMGINFSGYTSIMGSILLLGGVQLLVLGIIGEYIGRIYEQGKNRPLYLVSEIRGEPLKRDG